MSTADRDPLFRARLAAAYQAHNVGLADQIIYLANQSPEIALATVERCRTLLFGLELWAACFGHPHPATKHVGPVAWKFWRHATQPDQAVAALARLAQSPSGSEFAEDIDQLRLRLCAICTEGDTEPGVGT